MIEILIIVCVARGVGTIAERKGYSGSLFALLFGGLWFIGEGLGVLVGISNQLGLSGVYLMALALAVTGGLLGLTIVIALPPPRVSRRPKRDWEVVGRALDLRDRKPDRRRTAEYAAGPLARPRRPVLINDEDDEADEERNRPGRRPSRGPNPWLVAGIALGAVAFITLTGVIIWLATADQQSPQAAGGPPQVTAPIPRPKPPE
jgi:hypothetical protein